VRFDTEADKSIRSTRAPPKASATSERIHLDWGRLHGSLATWLTGQSGVQDLRVQELGLPGVGARVESRELAGKPVRQGLARALQRRASPQ
jgi:hypothetical protein